MSVKSKQMRKMSRHAALSGVIVSAIVGSGVVAAAADNHSLVDKGQVLSVVNDSAVTSATSPLVSGGTVYVGTTPSVNDGKGFLVTGSPKA